MATIDETIKIPTLGAGDKLYHYTSAAGLKGICDGRFWVTERCFLNDTMEFQVGTDVFCEVLDRHMNNKKLCQIIKTKVRKEVNRLQTSGLSIKDKIAYSGDYVISFCRDYDSPLMWGAYANYTGYCITFDFEKLIDALSHHLPLLHGQVVYNHEEQINLIEETLRRNYLEWTKGFDYLNSWKDLDRLTPEQVNDWHRFVAVEVSAYNMFFKVPCFEGEHEYRFVFSVGHDGGRYKKEQIQEQHFRIKDEVLIPYIEVPLLSLDAVEKVLVGSKNKSDIAIKGVQYLFRNLKRDIVIEQSPVPLRY